MIVCVLKVLIVYLLYVVMKIINGILGCWSRCWVILMLFILGIWMFKKIILGWCCLIVCKVIWLFFVLVMILSVGYNLVKSLLRWWCSKGLLFVRIVV